MKSFRNIKWTYFLVGLILASLFSSCNNVTSVTLNKSEIMLAEKQFIMLIATVLPDNAKNKAVIWTSSDESIVTVNSVGIVTAKAVGNAVVTATSERSGKTAVCAVTVYVPVREITLNQTFAALTPGNSLTLIPTVLPEKATFKTVDWTSSNTDVASVDSSGRVTGLSLGETTITATTHDGIKKSNCLVRVTDGMILTLNDAGSVWINMTGLGSTTIYWADGTVVTRTLSPQFTRYSHSHDGGRSIRTIIITGNITKLICSDNDPSDSYFKLTGLDVSKNTSLTYLDCSNNNLTSLDVSNNDKLTYLDCSINRITSLNVSNNTALTELLCYGNEIASLDVSKNAVLTKLYCYGNKIMELDVSNNVSLVGLFCQRNQLTDLDISRNIALVDLRCGENQITNLDVSRNVALTHLSFNNNKLTNIRISNNIELKSLDCSINQLTSLDVSRNTALEALNCSANLLTSLDTRNNPELRYLRCFDNQLTILDLSENSWLTSLHCNDNRLSSLDISNTGIGFLHCFNNQLTSLDIGSIRAHSFLTELDCSNNQLTSLDASKIINLRNLNCQSNQLSTNALNDLFNTLPNRGNWGSFIYVYNNPGTDDCYKSIAVRKGWTVVVTEKTE